MLKKLFLGSALCLAITMSPGGRTAFADDRLGAAQLRFGSGAYASAIDILKNIVMLRPEDAVAHFWMGRCYYELHDYNNAVDEAERSVRLAPDNALYHQWLGRAYGRKADREKSFFLARKVKKELEKAVELDPLNVDARRDLQRFYMEAPWLAGGSGGRALGMADAVASVDPVEGHLAHAEYYRRMLDNIPRAEQEYRKVLDMKPGRIGPYFEIADFYAQLGDARGLERTVAAAANVSSSDPRFSYYRGVAAVIGASAPAVAAKELKAYLETPERSDWPSHADAREWWGRLFEREGRLADAVAEYREALAIEPAREETRARLDRIEKLLKR